MKRLIQYIFSLLFALMVVMSACTDDLLYDPDGLGEGVVSLSATVQFEPQAAALETRATDGQAMRDINSLTVILYNVNDTTTPIVYNLLPDRDFEVRPSGGMPTDYNGNPAESSTAKASFTLPSVEVGYYYMYAIANMGSLTPEEIGTPSQLKHINLTWNKNNVASNNQMFGYFTAGDSGESEGYDAGRVAVGRNSTRFHAWLKRAASKVTIVFDGSKMHNDILVYIHKVTIHDIPANCYLGADNTPTDSSTQLIKQGESIYYNAAGQQLSEDFAPDYSQYESWMRIGRGSEKKGAVGSDEAGNTILHPEDATALYFYENLQGNFKDHANKEWFYKPQKQDSIGHIINKPGQPDYKDNVPCGSYIEVDAYYISNHAPVITSGKIKYRFMLGQDTEYDYNAFRNRHYKLTLQFKGYANQADWHIEYIEEKPEIYVPAKYYVSYLYNDKTMIPVRLTGECTDLECEIIENNWAPYDSTGVAFAEVPPAGEIGTDDGESFQWNRQVWENAGNYTTKDGGFKYGRHVVTYDEGRADHKWDTTMYITPVWAGFLSLTVPTKYQDESAYPKLPTTLFNGTGHNYSNTTSMAALENYFYAETRTGTGIVAGGGTTDESNDLPQNKRTFVVGGVGEGKTVRRDEGRNSYYVSKQLDGTTTLQMPLWTRPQSMIRISGFTGNNPYEPYMRKAVIRFRAKFKTTKGGTVTRVKDVPVFQVRRIVNPKGVWRSHNNNKPFNVVLRQRRNAGSKSFDSFRSEGSWKAYVETYSGEQFCRLSGGVETKNDTIFGDTDSPIVFDINFTGSTSASESNFAVVVVDYHGFACRHTILVRQGVEQSVEVVSGGGKWSSFSLYAANYKYAKTDGIAHAVLTKNPLAMGTYFKRGNLNQGILVKNNETYKNLEKITGELQLADVVSSKQKDKKANWSDIDGLDYRDQNNKIYDKDSINYKYSWPVLSDTVNNVVRQYTVPTLAQYEELLKNCECGFGVFYYDGATATGTNIEEAYLYKDHDNAGVESACGMRGAVAYNPQNARQVFFPLGPRGIGRRTLQGSEKGFEGVLRYGAVAQCLTVAQNPNNEYRPICYNLPAAPGALYWVRTITSNMGSWDINYGDLNFNSYDYATSFYKGGDALPIKLIQTK